MDALDHWIAREQEVDERIQAGSGYGIPPLARVATMSGLEALQAALRGELEASPISEVLGFRFIEVEKGRALFQGTPGARYCNPAGTIHGGWFSTILDSALISAVYSTLDAGVGYTTVELSLNFVKAMKPEVARVRAEAKVIHCGRRIATAEARLYDVEGTLYAHGTVTCLILPPRG